VWLCAVLFSELYVRVCGSQPLATSPGEVILSANLASACEPPMVSSSCRRSALPKTCTSGRRFSSVPFFFSDPYEKRTE